MPFHRASSFLREIPSLRKSTRACVNALSSGFLISTKTPAYTKIEERERVNALSSGFLISTRCPFLLSSSNNIGVNALSSGFLISTGRNKWWSLSAQRVSMPFHRASSFLRQVKKCPKSKFGVCQCPFIGLPHFYGKNLWIFLWHLVSVNALSSGFLISTYL